MAISGWMSVELVSNQLVVSVGGAVPKLVGSTSHLMTSFLNLSGTLSKHTETNSNNRILIVYIDWCMQWKFDLTRCCQQLHCDRSSQTFGWAMAHPIPIVLQQLHGLGWKNLLHVQKSRSSICHHLRCQSASSDGLEFVICDTGSVECS